jgi:transcriptional regulator with XRE-family HTH domain
MAGKPDLPDDDVRLIRAMHDEYRRLRREMDQCSVPAIAEKFGLSRSYVSDIVHMRKRREVI